MLSARFVFRFLFGFGSVFVVFVSVLGSVFASFAVPVVSAQANEDALIARVGEYVERYYTRAQTLVVTEAISVCARV